MANRLEVMSQMRGVAEILIDHTYPKAPYDEEQSVSILKQRIIVVDGYDVSLCYSNADYGKYVLNTLQIQSVDMPFLPFYLVCKLGREFFGAQELSYIEFLKNDRKVYCWVTRTRNGMPLPSENSKIGVFEDFEFRILNRGSLDLL